MTMKLMAWLVPGLLLIGVSGCPDVNVDPGEGVGENTLVGPTVEFDPSNSIVPFPNNLLIDPRTGKVNLPEQCNESPTTTATRTQVLNKLDGFGTFEVALQVTFTEPVDEASLTGKVLLLKRTSAGMPVDPATATPVPVKLIKGTTIRFKDQSDIKHCTNPQMINALTIVPLVPLDQKSTYTVALLAGIKTASGADFGPSFTWALIRQPVDPVTLDAEGNVVANKTPLDPTIPAQLAQLQGIDLLWKAHAQALAFLSAKMIDRNDILLAWELTTQTTTDQLDPTVAGSPASKVDMNKLAFVQSVTGGATAEQFLQAALPAGSCTVDGGALPCNAVGDVFGGLLTSNNYQVDLPPVVMTTSINPNEGGMIPGAWSDPINPMLVGGNSIQVLGVVPCVGAPPCHAAVPANGWPTIVFGHGLGSSKTTLLAIAGQLAQAGFASVAIDFVAHDSRAVRISTDPSIGCADTNSKPPPPPDFPQCYAPFLSTDLAVTRDNIRQSILDLQELVGALQGCGKTNCNTSVANFQVDVTNISYTGLSLGGIMGSTAVAVKPDFRSAVLNVPAVGWADILENTETDEIKCPLVNALIDAGILVGDKWNPTANTGLCTTDAWKMQPGYQQFSTIIRWVIDPADGANFTRKLATRKFLIQEVVGDQVVPNVATDNEGALVGLTPLTADPAGAPPVPPSAAITTMPTANKFVKYPTLPPAAPSFPGNTFAHASLLRPAPTPGTNTVGNDGKLGTLRLQTDAITYLLQNKGN